MHNKPADMDYRAGIMPDIGDINGIMGARMGARLIEHVLKATVFFEVPFI